MTRNLNIIGLILTTFGAALLVRFPPLSTMMTADGGGITTFHLDLASSISVIAFVAGFVVQLIAIARTKSTQR